MIKIRKSEDRGYFDHGWLNTYHSFSFARYYDPNFLGFRNLRVINEDIVEGHNGFPDHSHDNMEIISYVVKGKMNHKDSTGSKYTIETQDVQVMSAGTGITHSEFNNYDELVHFFQIWIIPDTQNLKPSYIQKNIRDIKESIINKNLRCVVSNNKKDEVNDSLHINQDIKLFVYKNTDTDSMIYEFGKNRHLWIQLIEGNLIINKNIILKSGDALSISNEENVVLDWGLNSHALIFDLN